MTSSQWEEWARSLSRDEVAREIERTAQDESGEAHERGARFEYLVIRSFELEIGSSRDAMSYARYPYGVSMAAALQAVGIEATGTLMEQFDGAVHCAGVSCLVECKTARDVQSDALAKLRYRLQRRPVGTIGCLFLLHNLTEPARLELRLTAPPMILLWQRQHLLDSVRQQAMVWCLHRKYRWAVETGSPDWNPFMGLDGMQVEEGAA